MTNYNDQVYEHDDNQCGTRIHAVMGAPFVGFVAINHGSGLPVSPAAILPAPIAVFVVTTVAATPLFGHPIMIYSIPQIVQVTYPASTANGGYFLDNYPVNRTTFRLVRGVQNEIRFYVRDVDRKPVALGMSETLTINIVDLITDTTLMTRNFATIDSSKGIYQLTILPAEMDEWPTTTALRWSIKYNRADSSSVILWTDRSYSPYSTCTVTEGPAPAPASTVTMLNTDLMPLVTNQLYSQALVGAATYGYQNGVQTFTASMTNFTGTVRIDASLATAPIDDGSSADWFQVDSQVYTANTGMVVLNETGNYLWMRVVVINAFGNTGTVDQILYKS